MPNIIEMRLKPQVLGKYGLPDIEYPVHLETLEAALGESGEMPFAEMLFGLQERSRAGTADWQRLEPAMDRLAQILAPRDDREVFYAGDDNWRLELGPLDLANEKLVAVQRGGLLIAALADRGEGLLRASVFRPLDAKSLGFLISLNMNPGPANHSTRKGNNLECAVAQARG